MGIWAPETSWADYYCNKAFSSIQLVFFSTPFKYCLWTEIYFFVSRSALEILELIFQIKCFMIILFSALLFSKSGCSLEMYYIYWHLLTACTEGVQKELLWIFILWLRPAFWYRYMKIYLVIPAFTSSPVSLLAAIKATVFSARYVRFLPIY